MKPGVKLPQITFRTRVRDEAVGGPNPFRWQDMTTDDYFAGKRVILFSLPGAFTPTCTTYQLPGFEKLAGDFAAKVIPDGSGEFARAMGMLVAKDNLGFGVRSWRYAAIVNNGVIEAWFEESGRCDNHGEDPYGESSPENLMAWLEQEAAVAAE